MYLFAWRVLAGRRSERSENAEVCADAATKLVWGKERTISDMKNRRSPPTIFCRRSDDTLTSHARGDRNSCH